MGKKDAISVIGKRKKAIARALIKEGSGLVRINKKLIENIKPEAVRLMLCEPLRIAGDLSKKVDIKVDVRGGGQIGQAEAARQAIARALVEFAKDDDLAARLNEYDLHMLVTDARMTEPHKPSRSSAGPRRHKQRSKR
jgi:small subunit ribosomal protein S9